MSGMSSSEAVECVRRCLNEKQVGHMGTLDPMADGVLIIGVGKCSRLFDYYLKKDKLYRGEITFGYSTDSFDGWGRITAKTDCIPTKAQVECAAQSLVGKQMQVPPLFSAKHVDGVRSYELARKGESATLAPVAIEIYSIDLVTFEDCSYTFDIRCSSSTYIRSIARDIAERTNSLATLTRLTRLKAGDCDIENSVTLSQLKRLKESALMPPEVALKGLERLDLADEYYESLDKGKKIAYVCDAQKALYCKGELFGIAVSVDGILKIKPFLKEN